LTGSQIGSPAQRNQVHINKKIRSTQIYCNSTARLCHVYMETVRPQTAARCYAPPQLLRNSEAGAKPRIAVSEIKTGRTRQRRTHALIGSIFKSRFSFSFNLIIINFEQFFGQFYIFFHIEDHYRGVLALIVGNRPLAQFKRYRIKHQGYF